MLNYLVKLVPVFYVNLEDNIKGRSHNMFILIDNKYKEDKGLLAHERCHVRQFLRIAIPFLLIGIVFIYYNNILLGSLSLFFMGLHGIFYKFNAKYKYESELEAYGYSLAYGNRSIEEVKYVLQEYYNLDDIYLVDFEEEVIRYKEEAKKDISSLI